MKTISKNSFPKPVSLEPTSLKPVEQRILSKDKFTGDSNASALFSGLLARLGFALKHHRKTISLIQWLLVIVYFTLLLLPVLPSSFADERFYAGVSAFSRLMLWGIGWPLIMLSMMLSGRVWCGLFCPDGTMTEFISRHGQKRSIPRWIRWKGWPCTVLVVTVLYGQLIGVYDNFPATLILLGVPTSLALITGFLYGNGKRIWCMYLCPGNGIFGLLAKLSPVYYKVDRKKWKQYSGTPERIDCPVLINIQQMKSASGCHACGRCIGYRNAVELGIRPPSAEIVTASENRISGADLFLLLWGIVGICTVALAWRGNGLYTSFNHFLSAQNGLHIHNLPWWVAANPSSPFLLVFIVIGGSAVSVMTYGLLRLAALVSGHSDLWKQLALCLIPVSGTGIFLGLCQIAFSLWQAHGIQLAWIPGLQFLILSVSALFSAWLGIKTIFGRVRIANLIAFSLYCLPIFLLFAVWAVHFQA